MVVSRGPSRRQLPVNGWNFWRIITSGVQPTPSWLLFTSAGDMFALQSTPTDTQTRYSSIYIRQCVGLFLFHNTRKILWLQRLAATAVTIQAVTGVFCYPQRYFSITNRIKICLVGWLDFNSRWLKKLSYCLTRRSTLCSLYNRFYTTCTCIFTAGCAILQSAILQLHVVRPSVRLSVCKIGGWWSHRLEYFENNFTTD